METHIWVFSASNGAGASSRTELLPSPGVDNLRLSPPELGFSRATPAGKGGRGSRRSLGSGEPGTRMRSWLSPEAAMADSELKHGPVGASAVHICVDMQRMF